MNVIENYYDNIYDEWERLDRHKLEFDITKRYLDKYIIGQSLEVFDIGGGPGRYSFYLAEKGHKVSLLDLSSRNIEVAKEKAKEFNVGLKEYIYGNALELEKYEQKYDVILLMGPLYHLVKEDQRKLAVEGALRLLKPGGIIFATFISNYAPIQDALKYFYEINDIQDVLRYLKSGENRPEEGFTSAYFSSPSEAKSLMSSYYIKELVFASVENILGSKEKELYSLSDEQYKKWIEIGFRLSTDKNLIGTGEHFLYIGQKE